MDAHSPRTIGLPGATGVGIGAIVGGGILALAGVAFTSAGPGALIAFSINAVIAVITALSFAELSTRFPETGGTYTFAKKVLSVEAAFAVGWVVWFASIVAAVLYAVGFGAFAMIAIAELWPGGPDALPSWLAGRGGSVAMAAAATLVFGLSLLRRGGGGGLWINATKLVVFAVLLAGGLWAFAGAPGGTLRETLTPLLPHGALGVVQAMGFTFIAYQGFDLIAAVAGEVRDPARTIPRAMLLSLGTAVTIYLPLLFVIATVGVAAGTPIDVAAAANPEGIVAVAAGTFLGPFGYWLVIAAALLSMLSALQANLFAASRVALAMARDRTLPAVLEQTHARHGTPVNAVTATTVVVLLLVFVLSDVAAAGAAASLIFLVTFALAHVIGFLARRRAVTTEPCFSTPLFPLVPVVGGLLCFGLAVFQAFAVPAAGQIAAVWLGIGVILFITLFARRARVRDAASAASDPHLRRLRGHRPLVLVPIANPTHATPMVEVASALAAPGVGRVMLLNVVRHQTSDTDVARSLTSAQEVLRESLLASLAEGLAPEALVTVSSDVWIEIRRVARTHDCESMLLGLNRLEDQGAIEGLMGGVDCDTVVLRAPEGWRLSDVRRILVPVGGRGHHDMLRARLIASLGRGGDRHFTYLTVVPSDASPERIARDRRTVTRLALDEARGKAEVDVRSGDDVMAIVTECATEHDLVLLGLQRLGRRRRLFGALAPRIARETSCAIIMISGR